PFLHAGRGSRTREFAARPELEHRDLADRRAATERFARKFAHRLPSDVRPVTARVADWLGRRASPQGVRRWLVLALALALGGCAGIDSSALAPGPGPAPGRRGEGPRGMREARDWPFTGTFVARTRRFAGLALAQIGRPGDAERELLAALAVAQVASLGQPHIGTVSSINGSLALLAAAAATMTPPCATQRTR